MAGDWELSMEPSFQDDFAAASVFAENRLRLGIAGLIDSSIGDFEAFLVLPPSPAAQLW